MNYANVMSTIAVVLALGGGAYAASKTTSKTIKNNTIKSIDQKDGKAVQGVDVVPDSLGAGQILESSLAQVPSAASASTADTATKADTADSATTADHATTATNAINNGLLGWALVDGETGDTFFGRRVGSANVDRQSEGIYCFNDLTFNPQLPVVIGNATSSNAAQDNFFVADVDQDTSQCPGDEDASVESRDDDPAGAAPLQDADFYIGFFPVGP